MNPTEAPVAGPAGSEPPNIGSATAPPELAPTVRAISDASRTLFRYGNRYFMVPLHRAGLAAWLGSPLAGWQCLLTTTGRRSGLPRHTPLNYLIADGAAWVVAAYGPTALWYRNVLDDARTTLLLPGRPPVATLASEVRDPSMRARIIPALARSMAGSDVPLVRIDPADGSALAAGPDDPGGLGWVWRQALAASITVVGIRALRGACRR